jgi:hypothetical protein
VWGTGWKCNTVSFCDPEETKARAYPLPLFFVSIESKRVRYPLTLRQCCYFAAIRHNQAQLPENKRKSKGKMGFDAISER